MLEPTKQITHCKARILTLICALDSTHESSSANLCFVFLQPRVIEELTKSHGVLTLEPWNVAPDVLRVLPLQLSSGVEVAEGCAMSTKNKAPDSGTVALHSHLGLVQCVCGGVLV